MRALVVYESMYGNTHEVAERIGEGLRPAFEVDVVPVADASAEKLAAADLVVVGAPTHIRGLPSKLSREAAEDALVRNPGLVLDEHAGDAGVREWLHDLDGHAYCAAFDTRIDSPAVFTGRASRAIARRLRRRGLREVAAPESFLVDKHDRLLDGEAERARSWASNLATTIGSPAS